MSVFKDKRSPYYRYDFIIEGRRFYGSTECTSRREAERFESERKRQERERLTAERTAGSQMTFDVAAARYWTEVGQHHAGEGKDNTFRALAWLVDQIGPQRMLHHIDDALVASLVARRRGEKARNRAQPVRPATVNRSCTEPLRKILNRARDVWKVEVQDIAWGRHLLSEPRERVRELTPAEEDRAFDAIRADFAPLLRFSLLSGMRLSECLYPRLTWQSVDWGNRRIRVVGKGGKVGFVPLTAEMREVLWPLQGRDPEAVFCYQAQGRGPGKARKEKGTWHPITASGLKSFWRRFKGRVELQDYRWHDNRHTAATRLLRTSGNLRLVQRLLRHEKIETTTKYSHATEDDLRAAMEETAQNYDAKSPKNPRIGIAEVQKAKRSME